MDTKKEKSFLNSIKNYFKFDKYEAIIRKEIIGGISTFIAMAYILAVNPGMIGPALNVSDKMGGLFLSTAISSFIATLFMGLYAKIPVSLAPGMGLNAFFAYNVGSQIGFESALSVTIISGILYFIVVLTPAREKISALMPTNLKLAIGTGVGFFIAFIGLQDAQIIVKDPSSALVSGLGNFTHPLVIVSVVVLFVALILHYSKVPGAIVITMVIGSIIVLPMIATGFIYGVDPQSINPVHVGYKGFNTFGDITLAAWKGFANTKTWTNPITYIGALSFLYMDFFDTTGTLITIDKELNITEKDPKWLSKANLVDALGTITGASIGSTTVTAFVESTVGISAGAKTGLSSVVCSLLFGLSIAVWPIIQIFMPIVIEAGVVKSTFKPITGPILILVGTMMITQIRHFEWEIVIDIPTLFMTIIFMMLSNSIAYGIAFGIITFVVLNLILGTWQKYVINKKKIINSMEITTTTPPESKTKTREFYYLKRVGIPLIVISIISLSYIIIQQGMTYLHWFT